MKAAESETQRRKRDFGNKTQNGAQSLSLEIGFCLREERKIELGLGEREREKERERERVCVILC